MTDKRFKPGQSGNPSGRRPGSRNRASLAAEMLLEGESEALTRTAIALALEGDTTALKMCLDRIAPPRKDAPVTLDLPALTGPETALAGVARAIAAAAAGEITPSEAGAVVSLIEAYRKAYETQEIEKRLAALEDERARP
jgi:hypothetical protein